jgi:hypothetical protein
MTNEEFEREYQQEPFETGDERDHYPRTPRGEDHARRRRNSEDGAQRVARCSSATAPHPDGPESLWLAELATGYDRSGVEEKPMTLERLKEIDADIAAITDRRDNYGMSDNVEELIAEVRRLRRLILHAELSAEESVRSDFAYPVPEPKGWYTKYMEVYRSELAAALNEVGAQ